MTRREFIRSAAGAGAAFAFPAIVPASVLGADARRPVAYGGFSLRMDPMVRGFRMEGVGGSPSADKNVGGPKGMTAVRLVDPANGHGVDVKMLAPLAGERIYTWSDHCFVNPMPLYEQPISLEPGETVSLDYEVKVF